MEEKESYKIGLSTFFLIIAIIIIIVLGYFLFNLYSKNHDMIIEEDELNKKIMELEDNISKSKENGEKISFSKIMDMIYMKDGTEINGNKCDIYINDHISMTFSSGKDEEVVEEEYTTVEYDGEKISFHMNNISTKQNTSTLITGITGEVVSIKMIQEEGTGTASYIYFLTRDGDLYYLDNEMINSKDFTAKKLNNLKEVVYIDIVGITYEGAMHGSTTLIATTYTGEKINVQE